MFLPGGRPRPPPEKAADLGIGLLFDVIRDAGVVADDQGTILFWNQGATEVFGWTREEAVGRNVAMLVPEAYLERHHRGMERYAETGHGAIIDTRRSMELPALRKDGTEIVIDLSLASIEEGGRRYALALVRDATERARLRRELERRSADLERTVRELSRLNESLLAFTYVVSHDLKEPVRAIDAYLRILQEDHGDALPPPGADVLARAIGATDRLASLLRGLLNLSRVDREPLAARPVGLRTIVESDACRGAYESLVRERGARLEVVEDAPEALAPPSVFCQVLSNLLTNAMRHNPKPSPRVRLASRLDEEGCVEVRVEDDGPGFPPDLVERFNAGAKETLRAGFGLLIARRAVERMGGRMWLGASAELGGAAVWFTVPAAG